MKRSFLRIALALATGPVVLGAPPHWTGNALSNVEDEWFRAWPPVSATYSLPSPVRQGGGAQLGDLDTLELHATHIEAVEQTERFNWLLGLEWRRIQAGVPPGVALPATLQSAAAVVGFDWFPADRWRARLEVLPGVYSDFRDVGGDDFNAPFNLEVSCSVGPNLLLGGQLNVNGRRESPLLGAVGVRWKFSEDWLLSLWFPRPRVEYFVGKRITLFGGASFVSGTFQVADDFGRTRGQPSLDGQPVTFQEIRAGVGVRYAIGHKFAVEFSGGATVDRRYEFEQQNIEFKTSPAPYAQVGFGLRF